MSNILVIDDDVDICTLLNRYLTKNGFNVTTCHSGKTALESIINHPPEIVLCDFRLEDMNGSELLDRIKQRNPGIPVIIMTGYSDVRTAVSIMKSGAFDYVTKPLLPEEILLTIKKGLDSVKNREDEGDITQAIEAEVRKQSRKAKSKYIFGKSEVFKKILEQIHLVAPTNYSVIIYGESGSGKESIAAEIHNNSARAQKPFVAIDCGSLSKELASSELFGHEKGSFTGAVGQKIGSLEIANGGTVFLDEIGNLSYDIQVALLRVVQERKMRRVGGVKDIDLDVRIIVASNERLSEQAKKGKFREDLYHRFNEFSIEVPPLRHRQEDIMMFAEFFLERTNAELNKNVKGFSEDVIRIFHHYNWPGNLRELSNVIKRSTLLTSGEYVEVSALPFEITHYDKLNFLAHEPAATEPQMATAGPLTVEAPKKHIPLNDYGMKHASIDAEFELIVEALKKCNYNKSKAAQLLNIDRKTLYNKMKQYKEFNGNL
jgi:two-component system, NtrC family, response regulator HydG